MLINYLKQQTKKDKTSRFELMELNKNQKLLIKEAIQRMMLRVLQLLRTTMASG